MCNFSGKFKEFKQLINLYQTSIHTRRIAKLFSMHIFIYFFIYICTEKLKKNSTIRSMHVAVFFSLLFVAFLKHIPSLFPVMSHSLTVYAMKLLAVVVAETTSRTLS